MAFAATNPTPKEHEMLNVKTAKKQIKAVKKAVTARMDHITPTEKLAGAAAIGVAVGVAATALGSAMLHNSPAATAAKPAKKPAA
jgi:hypothetical protein